ncbi:MAG TPA: 1,2-phenylacetyl-CoA epoxidase subunit PaaD [Steroidobacteraceae bacterium]|nr:1,2-phenylacetyl-CoA epoxidase subunit PaaD [Steroidobacteraceae bacterium]
MSRVAPVTGAAGERARRVLDGVMDPEIPVVSVTDLGIIRFIEAQGERLRVGVAPTYLGCPATRVIQQTVAAALQEAGFAQVEVVTVLDPPWSSADLSERGRARLEAFGIAPPTQARSHDPFGTPRRCPHCHSDDTECVSEFGSTPCKALYRCRSCLEPFDYFKCL